MVKYATNRGKQGYKGLKITLVTMVMISAAVSGILFAKLAIPMPMIDETAFCVLTAHKGLEDCR